MKFKIHRIIGIKFSNRNQIFSNKRNMKEGAKEEIASWSRKETMASVVDKEVRAVANTYTIFTMIFRWVERQVREIIGQLVGSDNVWIPSSFGIGRNGAVVSRA